MKTMVMNLVGKKHEALSAVSLPVVMNEETEPKIARLAERMVHTVRARGGLALAAPQVGVNQRIVVLWDGNVWLNPRITIEDPEETAVDIEACLSLPGRAYLVDRAINVEATVMDLRGEETTFDLQDLEARMIQHEIDHLDGLLISQRGKEVANLGPSALKL